MHDITESTLYGIVDLGYVDPHDLVTLTHQLIEGGIDIIQLRAKNHSPNNILKWAKLLQPICNEAQIPFIINDFPEIAKSVNADGVHIGQDDGSLVSTRKIVGDDMLIGRSTHSVEQAEVALEDGFNYIGFGPIYTTPTKQGRPAIGLENISIVQDTVGTQIPVFCIGGIKHHNLPEVRESGAKSIVAVSELLCAKNPIEMTASMKKILTENTK